MSGTTDSRVAGAPADDRRGLLEIEAGQVFCPRRGTIDIEHCWTCREFGGRATGREALVCRWSRLWSLTSRPTTQAEER